MPATGTRECADAAASDRTVCNGRQGGVTIAGHGALGASLHRSCRPLDEVDLSTLEERGQLNLFEIDRQTGVCRL
jgi:hypothetical protein